MRVNLAHLVFVIIGIAVGIILSLQVRANPESFGSYPLEQLEVQKSLLATFSFEQQQLKKDLDEVEAKLEEAQKIIERRSSRQTVETLDHLKNLTGLSAVEGVGIRITLNDNMGVSRLDFSALNENFVKATDLRDLVNALFLKDASAVAINGKRVMPLTPIQSAFDSILIGNIQINAPFVVEAIGHPAALTEAALSVKKEKIQIYADGPLPLTVPPLDSARSLKFLSLQEP